MSSVTNIILTYGNGWGEGPGELLELVNNKCDCGRLVNVEDPKYVDPNAFVNGGKGLEINIAVGAFNYLGVEKWISEIKEIDFKGLGYPCVQMFVMGNHDYCFRKIDIFVDEDYG